jgi:hypothetical protein
MFKKSLSAMVLFGAMAVPAVAQAVPQAAAAGGVQLTWVDGKVKVTWTETGAAANTISLRRPGVADKVLGTTTAGGANQLLVAPAALEPTHDPAATAKIVVSGGGADGSSAAFDRYIRGTDGFDAGIVGGNLLAWAANPEAADPTPNDPLDVKQVRYIPRLTFAGCKIVELPATTEPNGQAANQGQPFNFRVYTASEWGESLLGVQHVRTSAITMSAPASTKYGATITITGGVSMRHIAESGSTCVNADDPSKDKTQVSLQARNSATGNWYSVGARWTDAQGKYSIPVTNPGARQYRTAVDPRSAYSSEVQYPSITAAKEVRATTRVVEAKFISPTIRIGQQPNAYLRVEPAGSQRAALQFKNTSGVWQGLMYKTLSSGRGLTGPFAFNRLGVTQFRWWVPASASSTGLPVDAVYSNIFTLTVL